MPKMICHKCLFKLDNVYEFRLKCLQANDKLTTKLKTIQHVPAVQLYLSKLEEKVWKYFYLFTHRFYNTVS